jgi:hypothetical protein
MPVKARIELILSLLVERSRSRQTSVRHDRR